jgi:hypothetical protein
MESVTTQSIVSPDNYAELKNMMLSNDDASKNMALTILEQSNFEISQVYILCLLKETFSDVFKNDKSKLEKEYPNLHKELTNALKDADSEITTLSFKKLYELSMSRKVEKEMNFLLNIFKEELIGLLKDYGFSFLEYLDITITPKKV